MEGTTQLVSVTRRTPVEQVKFRLRTVAPHDTIPYLSEQIGESPMVEEVSF